MAATRLREPGRGHRAVHHSDGLNPYEIDLTDEHAAALEESLDEWIAAARKITGRSAGTSTRSTSGRASSGPKREDLDAIRAWARENGHTVAERGRIKQGVIDAYDNR